MKTWGPLFKEGSEFQDRGQENIKPRAGLEGGEASCCVTTQATHLGTRPWVWFGGGIQPQEISSLCQERLYTCLCMIAIVLFLQIRDLKMYILNFYGILTMCF